MKSKVRLTHILALVALMNPLVASAHPFHWASDSLGFVGGLIHPLTGTDHIITMLAVGLWMSQTGRRLVYLMPFVFVAFMLMGCGLSLIPIEIAHAENVMYLTVLMLGLMLVSGRHVPLSVGIIITNSVAVFHGYVHAYDMWLDVSAIGYTIGFALTTMVLIMVGVVVRMLINRLAIKYSPNTVVGR